MKKALFKNDYFNTLYTKMFYCIITFIATAILTRYLGTQYKGEYTWVTSVSSIIAIVAGLGIYQSIAFYRRKGEENINEQYVNMFILQALVYCVIAVVLIILFPEKTVILIAVMTIVDTISQQMNMLLLIDNIKERNRILLQGAVINFILSAVLLICAPASVVGGAAVLISTKLFYTVFYTRQMHVKINPFSVSLKKIFEKIKFGILPMFSFLLVTLNYRVDVLMLKQASNIDAVQLSYYAAGVSIAEIAWLIPDIFKEVLFSKTAKDNNYDQVSAALRISNLILVIVIAGLIVLGKPAIYILYGKSFVQSYSVTVLLFCGIPAMAWFKIINTLFVAQGKKSIGFVVLFISTTINIIANALMIPQMGISGAAIASIISYSICGLVFLIIYSKVARVSFFRLFIPTVADVKTILNRHGKEKNID
ncbi:lipid II flippase MurJ [Hespellia stercorisuis]|uniref:Membrane protein involved in the export of O-antigen and teichoic acid n=1 Tax=Hespellia stercorisuis DSM 15480 TaxID=1121950 RepID=A0A1M6JY42_9FIRM|nr:polysaccharide biosynthesis C-terminal domain-containing protein [Hespellia stercorisuis]SHJ51629.1 Membrane protein involved in the export of O-antigen and teichoic acid [Hespellia stercorisuis DSM 15480]